MKNISYFCIVKHLKRDIKKYLALLILLTISPMMPVFSQSEVVSPDTSTGMDRPDFDPMDSVEVSLLTCSPHEEVYSLYGHTALRWHNTGQTAAGAADDYVFNWGSFSFDAPFFVLRFVFGLTDYELATTPLNYFNAYYKQWGSSVTEQVLNLTPQEKRKVQQALGINLMPENRVYRYNYFYDNCSTRPRDIIERCLDGKLEYQPREDYSPSYREMIHECTRNHPWARFGNDMLLGIRADQPTNRMQQEFLPANLMYDFDHAQLYANGEYRPLVKERRLLVPPGVQVVEQDFPVAPLTVFICLLAVCVVIGILEWRRHKTYKYWDALLMLAQGLAGCVLFVMIFSQHPTTSLNLQLLLLNPLPLFFIPSVLKRKQPSRWWIILLTMIVLFAIGGIFQTYAEGMMVLALCLLTRYMSHYKHA